MLLWLFLLQPFLLLSVNPPLTAAVTPRPPDFIIPGAMKSGTSSLAADLAKHPMIALASREIHYLSNCNEYSGGKCEALKSFYAATTTSSPPQQIETGSCTVDGWGSAVLAALDSDQQKHKQKPKHNTSSATNVLVGDKTPSYMLIPHVRAEPSPLPYSWFSFMV